MPADSIMYDAIQQVAMDRMSLADALAGAEQRMNAAVAAGPTGAP